MDQSQLKRQNILFPEQKENLGFSEFNAVYAAEVEQLDVSVKRIYETLKAENLLENTLFIFASDNGGFL